MQMNGICRVCSSRGEYNIFSVIPSYLHATPNEFVYWKKDISVLLEETTGLIITPNDGLPDKICALCISYLKHAATFRQQAIENVLNLKTIQHLLSVYDGEKKQQKCSDNNENDDNVDYDDGDDQTIMITEENLNFKTTRTTDTANFINNILNRRVMNNDYVNQNFFNNQNSNRKYDKNSSLEINMNSLNFNNKECNIKLKKSTLKRSYVNSRTNKGSSSSSSNNFRQKTGSGDLEGLVGSGIGDNNSSSGDDMELWNCDESHQKLNTVNFFDYTEKIFEEDDIMELDALKDAKIFNIPIHCKERKCRACYRRYMTEETFDNHEKTCLELKFLCLIEEVNRLVDIRVSKTISPHEFIRRMIFSLRKTYQWLNSIDLNGEKDESVSIGNNRMISNNYGTSNNNKNITNNIIFDKIINNEKSKFNENLDNIKEIIIPPPFFATTSQRDQNKIDDNFKNNSCDIEQDKLNIDSNDSFLKLSRKEHKKHENDLLYVVNISEKSNSNTSNVQTIKPPLTLSCSTLEQDIISSQHPIENLSTANINSHKFFLQFSSNIKKTSSSSSSFPHSTPIMIHPNTSELDNLKYQDRNQIDDLNKKVQRQNIIDLFEENTNRNEGIVDLMNILNLEAKKSD